ncbi:hypothetical protein BCR35DRAFT_310651 [Leucosporidium creatinivorum]|uniref:F-box domain-containing protein n=1 Tax=Leucosporidium creatinivorum TaxID=106004 RepID=A0A1Y2D0Q6_9BASI|nr:hypothetical protein BCR35DRAFT_310651 [Leucosporidium creatinivorum]
MPSNGQAATFSNLPLELKMEILRYARMYSDIRDLKAGDRTLRALSRVDSTFHRLAVPSLWESLDLTRMSLADLLFCATDIAPRYADRVKDLTLSDTYANHARTFMPLPPSPAPAETTLILDLFDLPEEERSRLASVQKSQGFIRFQGYLETYLHAFIVRLLPTINSLFVEYTLVRNDEPYKELQRALHHLAPRVRTLELTCEATVDIGCREKIAQQWLAPFTELESLYLDFAEREGWIQELSAPASALAPLPLVQALTGMTKLKKLEIDNEALLSAELACADWSRVPLEELKISLGRPLYDDESLQPAVLLPLISQFNNTLVELDIADFAADRPAPAAPSPSNRPPPSPLESLTLPDLVRLDLDILDSDGAFISSFANCPVTRLTLGKCAIGTPISTFTILIDGSWKPTLRHLTLPYDDSDHFQSLHAITSRNVVAVETEKKDSEFDSDSELDEEVEDTEDEFGYYSDQERLNRLLGFGEDFMSYHHLGPLEDVDDEEPSDYEGEDNY